MHHPFLTENWKNKLHVVTCIYNPERYRSRPELYQEFAKHIADLGGILWTVEITMGDRSFTVTKPDNPFHIQLRTGGFGRMGTEIWLKENALNIGISRIPKDVRYIAWIDADVHFHRHDIFEEIIHQLQHFHFIQPWTHSQDVCNQGMPIGKQQISFCYGWVNGLPMEWHKGYGRQNAHPGYAWACRREALDDVGGLVDWAILGSADRHMAYALVDKVEWSYNDKMHPSYKKKCKIYQVRCRHFIHRNIGYVSGLITHNYHGSKVDRKYSDRWSILVDEQYNVDLDIKYDTQGIIQLTERNWRLRDKIRKYFRERNEDGLHNHEA